MFSLDYLKKYLLYGKVYLDNILKIPAINMKLLVQIYLIVQCLNNIYSNVSLLSSKDLIAQQVIETFLENKISKH